MVRSEGVATESVGAMGGCASRDPNGLHRGIGTAGSEMVDRARKNKRASNYILLVLLFSFSSKPGKFKQLQNFS